MFSRIHHWSQHLFARLSSGLPSCCALCGTDSKTALCNPCRDDFFKQTQHRCTQCATPLTEPETQALCGDCLKQPPAFDATIVAADYAAPIDQLVLALKFGARLALAPLFADMLRDAMLKTPSDQHTLPVLLMAVPLGPQRLAERGFNQALEIAKPLARSLGIPLDARLMMRVRDTRSQALLHPDERHKNIHKGFLVSEHAINRVHGQHIGVVDDVITTGETLNELAKTLKRFGATRVTNFVFARTPHR